MSADNPPRLRLVVDRPDRPPPRDDHAEWHALVALGDALAAYIETRWRREPDMLKHGFWLDLQCRLARELLRAQRAGPAPSSRPWPPGPTAA